MSNTESLPTLPGEGGKYLRYVVAFVVTLGAGLAPVFGLLRIPGFSALLDVMPRDLQKLIPFASLLMTVTAIRVRFFSRDRPNVAQLRRAFNIQSSVFIALIFALYVAYEWSVIRIEIPGGGTSAAYVVGDTLLPSCPCAKRSLDIRECIGTAITTNPNEVSRCYPLREIRMRTMILSLLYLLLMFILGALIGLLVRREWRPQKS